VRKGGGCRIFLATNRWGRNQKEKERGRGEETAVFPFILEPIKKRGGKKAAEADRGNAGAQKFARERGKKTGGAAAH